MPRISETGMLEADIREPGLDNLEVLLVDEKSVREDQGYVTLVPDGPAGELRPAGT